ncbi:tRNA wybutosine-synthesizing protein 5-like [Petromyzon marinus]|uniref:tRNA wybutosine-synthesizing protein 5-like n=1 Tax=Petromyzon marinus TaxID=7757 RepID=UPI003F70C450
MAEHGTSPPPPPRRTSARLLQPTLRILLVALMAPGCANPWWSASPPAEAAAATSVSPPPPQPEATAAAAAAGHPPGHMKPLGSHAPPEGDAWSLSAPPSASSFFRDFVSPGRPVLLRGAAARMPAYRRWCDDAYLSGRYGSLEVTVELGRKENRSAGVYSSSLASFLRSFARDDVYAVCSLPAAMRPEVWPPPCLACGGLQRSLVDSVLWLSGGGTKSVLHYDSLDNVICVLAGRKRFFLADREELARLASGHADAAAAEDADEEEFLVGVDVDRVDMYRYPGLRRMRWYSATVDAGDCFFVPYKWLHQVNSDAGRSLAVNFWFVHLRWFNQTDCEKTPTPSSEGVPLSDYRMASTLELLRSRVLEDFEGRDVVTPGEMKEWLRARGQTNGSEILARLFQASDSDGDGALSMEELYTAPAEMFASLLGVAGDTKTEGEHGPSPLHQASQPQAQQARTSDEL